MTRKIREEMDYSDTDDENDMTEVFKNIPDAFPNADEYSIFSQTLTKVIQETPTLSHWIDQLPEEQKNIYVELLHTRRIKIKDMDIRIK
jgi:hypothetical protein